MTLYVSDAKGDDVNGTGSIDAPYKTIQTALINGYKQSSVIVVRVLEGTYSGEGNTNLTVASSLDITIVGDGRNKTLIDGRDLDWFLNVATGNGIVKVANMTVANVTMNYVDAKNTTNIRQFPLKTVLLSPLKIWNSSDVTVLKVGQSSTKEHCL